MSGPLKWAQRLLLGIHGPTQSHQEMDSTKRHWLETMDRALPRERSYRMRAVEDICTIHYDDFGQPRISARSRPDAFFGLGFAVARDRFFQMDLLRRRAAGELAEIFSHSALDNDVRKRTLGFRHVASAACDRLPPNQADLVRAFTLGINHRLGEAPPPFECSLLRYTPRPWREWDCLLVALNLFDDLCGEQASKETLAVLEAAFPPEIVRFFASDEDDYSSALIGGGPWRPRVPVPVQQLRALISNQDFVGDPWPTNPIVPTMHAMASNAFVVRRDAEQAGLLASDLHIPLSVPNLFYAAHLRYGSEYEAGVVVPGFPAIVAGSTRHVAWGITNLCGDNLDLIRIEGVRGDTYLSKNGRRRFVERHDTIVIRDGSPLQINIKLTEWGPVVHENFLGSPCALRWAALDPSAVDVGLACLATAQSVEEAIKAANTAACPPLNVMLAAEDGQIAWTIAGRLPNRPEPPPPLIPSSMLDTSTLEYVRPSALPRIINPGDDFLVTANHRVVGRAYGYLGLNFSSGVRASRIAELLQCSRPGREVDAWNILTDTYTGFLGFYRDLAVSVLTPHVSSERWGWLLGVLSGWDLRAEIGSPALFFLSSWRDQLAQSLIGSYLEPCSRINSSFRFAWANMETPLRSLLETLSPEVFPFKRYFPDWNSYLLASLGHCLDECQPKMEEPVPLVVRHPLTVGHPELADLLDMPPEFVAGSAFSVRLQTCARGSAARIVVRPGMENEGLLGIACGQSGQALSSHYRDGHKIWAAGAAFLHAGRQSN
jgi:penicillin amidase